MDIKTKTFNHALNTLKALGAHYVIMQEDGALHTYGNLEVAEKKNKRAKAIFPHGTYIKLVKEQGIENMKIGDVFVFDPKDTRVESVRSTVIHYADKVWGKNSITTTLVDGKIEALRII